MSFFPKHLVMIMSKDDVKYRQCKLNRSGESGTIEYVA